MDGYVRILINHLYINKIFINIIKYIIKYPRHLSQSPQTHPEPESFWPITRAKNDDVTDLNNAFLIGLYFYIIID